MVTSILSTGTAATHCSIHQPILEVLFARLWSLQVSSALCDYPVHQLLLQVWVVLLVDLLLHLPAQSVAGPSVCHGSSGNTLVFVVYSNSAEKQMAHTMLKQRYSGTK